MDENGEMRNVTQGKAVGVKCWNARGNPTGRRHRSNPSLTTRHLERRYLWRRTKMETKRN